LFIFSALLVLSIVYSGNKNTQKNLPDDKDITDESFKFTFKLPDDWSKTDMKFTSENDAISYSFERNDKKCAIMLLAFKLTTVKNLEDFVYTMEKDISLNIPQRDGDYSDIDNDTYDGKSAKYKDAQYVEFINYYRTKLVDAPNNFVYMLRFITTNSNFNTDLESQIKKIAASFHPTAE
jgi:hypothetical protein